MSENKVPETQRCLSGSNWENFQSIIKKSNEQIQTQNGTSNGKRKSFQKVSKWRKYNIAEHEEKVIGTQHFIKKQQRSLTKCIAIDCEMVGIGDGNDSMLARVSIVNKYGYCLYDKYVKPREKIIDYRTAVSGIRPYQVENGEEFNVVQQEVAEILKGRILIGHALRNDLAVLFLSHPRRLLRDTSRYKPFHRLCKGNIPSLKRLVKELLGREIQTGEHNSVEDARATMQIYMLFKSEWESQIYSKQR